MMKQIIICSLMIVFEVAKSLLVGPQAQALQDLYLQCKGNAWKYPIDFMNHWSGNITNETLPHCEWSGPSCDPSDATMPQVVRELNMRTFGMDCGSNGFLTSFSALSTLRLIDISGQRRGGTLPSDALSSMHSLDIALMSMAGFEGGLPVIPAKTRILSLSHNSLTGPFTLHVAIPLLHMQSLDLSHNQLSGDFPCTAVRYWNNITSINMEGNAFTGDVCEEFRTLPNLRALRIAGNEWSMAQPFPMWILSVPSFSISGNFTGPCPVPPSLRKSAGLKGVSICCEGDKGVGVNCSAVNHHVFQKIVTLNGMGPRLGSLHNDAYFSDFRTDDDTSSVNVLMVGAIGCGVVIVSGLYGFGKGRRLRAGRWLANQQDTAMMASTTGASTTGA
jgi:hypothetical protein